MLEATTLAAQAAPQIPGTQQHWKKDESINQLILGFSLLNTLSIIQNKTVTVTFETGMGIICKIVHRMYL